jgi:4-oxalocrotonate tautomerase
MFLPWRMEASHVYIASETLMPLVRISLHAGTSPEYRKAIAEGVHRAMVESLAVPEDDRFQVLAQHGASDLIYDPQYLGIQRSNKIVIIQVTLSCGRKLGQKRAFYKQVTELLKESPGLRPEDVMINLVEVIWKWRGTVHVNQCRSVNSRLTALPDKLVLERTCPITRLIRS